MVQNSIYTLASTLDSQIGDRRITRNIVQSIKLADSRPQYTSRGSGALAKAIKA